MSSDEFSLIEKYFSAIGTRHSHTRHGIGDDAAVCAVPDGHQLVSSMDTLNEGIHFLADTTPADIARKALAVNLSDLAAMAADPAWFLLSLSLPKFDEQWLAEFSAALTRLAEEHQIALVGGDTCRGPLSITIQITGTVPKNDYVTRAGAKPGDSILVSGKLGNAALGRADLQGHIRLPEAYREDCIDALLHPRPRLELVPFLRQYASAAIDVSDGLLGDLGHILVASNYGANLQRDALPVGEWIRQNKAYDYALEAGDDYEICCCLPAEHLVQIEPWNRDNPECSLTVVGEITESGYFLCQDGQKLDMKEHGGYRHFG